jgi:hypothetical protein
MNYYTTVLSNNTDRLGAPVRDLYVPSVVSSVNGKRIQVLLSIQETAFDLRSGGTVRIRTVRWLRQATDIFRSTVHWAEVQKRPVRAR